MAARKPIEKKQDVWTANDEELLNTLQERRKAHYEAAKAELASQIRAALDFQTTSIDEIDDVNELATVLAAYADHIVPALEPFLEK